jgi:hypothetical protein
MPLLTCEPILAELAEKLQLKRGFDAAKAAEIADEFRAFSKVVPITGALKVVAADPADVPISPKSASLPRRLREERTQPSVGRGRGGVACSALQ